MCCVQTHPYLQNIQQEDVENIILSEQKAGKAQVWCKTILCMW